MRRLRNRAGKASHGRGRKSSAYFEFVNAPAERCTVRRGSLGHRFVRYRARDYIVTGLYYVPQPWKKPRAFFVLRSVDRRDGAPAPERPRLRGAGVVRAGLYALIIIILLTLPASIASKPASPVPPVARGGASFTAW